jgi:hypothetical protein
VKLGSDIVVVPSAGQAAQGFGSAGAGQARNARPVRAVMADGPEGFSFKPLSASFSLSLFLKEEEETMC